MVWLLKSNYLFFALFYSVAVKIRFRNIKQIKIRKKINGRGYKPKGRRFAAGK